jgi:hypothetical protein
MLKAFLDGRVLPILYFIAGGILDSAADFYFGFIQF